MRTRQALALVVGLFVGVALSYIPTSDASRNSSGTYSLPAGQPVVSGTTISSTVHNALASDLATELTSSLDRSGRGAMLAPLQLSNGTVAAPSLTFGTDADTGLYRVSANQLGITAGGVKVAGCTATGVNFPLGIAATQATADTSAITATGNGAGHGVAGTGGATGHGLYGTGGASGGSGVIGTGGATNGSGGVFTGGASNGPGVTATGDGTSYGVSGTGGDTSGTGVIGTGGAPDGAGGEFIGTGTGSGIKVGAGHIKLTAANPASTDGFANKLTPANIPKAWASISANGFGVYTVLQGFNIASVVHNGAGGMTVTYTTAMVGTNPAIIVSGHGPCTSPGYFTASGGQTTITLSAFDFAATPVNVHTCASSTRIDLVVFGTQ
jgi:hypothetical protein